MMRRNHEDPPSPRELNTEIAEIPATMVLCPWARDRDARNGQMTAFVNDLRSVHQAAGGGRRPRGVAELGQVHDARKSASGHGGSTGVSGQYPRLCRGADGWHIEDLRSNKDTHVIEVRRLPYRLVRVRTRDHLWLAQMALVFEDA